MVGPRRQGVASAIPEPLTRGPERQALAKAIATAEEHRKGLEACRAAIQAAEAMEAVAEAAVEAARTEVEQAKSDRAAEITAAAAAGQIVPPSVRQREARQREVEAQDELEAIRSSMAVVRAPLSDCEYWAQNSAERVGAAASRVVALRLPEAIAVAMKAIKNAEVCVRTAHAAYRAASSGNPGDLNLTAQINVLNGMAGANWEYRDPNRGDAPDWRRALAELQENPDAPVPVIRDVADMSPGEPGPGATGLRRTDW